MIATSEQERDEFCEGGMKNPKSWFGGTGLRFRTKFPPAGFFRERWNVAKNVKMSVSRAAGVEEKSRSDVGSILQME